MIDQQALQNQRLTRLQNMGYKGPVGAGPLNENVNGQVHSHAVRQQWGDVLSGQHRNKYKEMFSKKSKNGPGGFSPIPVPKQKGPAVAEEKRVEVTDFSGEVDKGLNSELSMIDRMFDPDYGSSRPSLSMNMPHGGLDNYGPNWNAMDVSNQLQNRLTQKQAEVQQYQQQHPPQHYQPQVPAPQMPQTNTLSYRDFASDKQAFAPEVSPVAEAAPEQRKDYKAYQNYMYNMNEGMIREIAEEIAAETVKSVLAEHIKSERTKYVFERVTFKKKDGTLVELLKKDDKYYELTSVETSQGTFTALKERKVKSKKKKSA
ncbi:MAG: hypothetical protein P8J32_00160 [bacterium]|nr:hypothetical protein [bacterium]